MVITILIIHQSRATLSDHDDVKHSPSLFTVRRDLGQVRSRHVVTPPAPAGPIISLQRDERKDNGKGEALIPTPLPSRSPGSSPTSRPLFPLRVLALGLFPRPAPPAKDVKNRAGAPLVRKQVPDLEAAFPPSSLSSNRERRQEPEQPGAECGKSGRSSVAASTEEG